MRSQPFNNAWHLVIVVFLLAGCDRSGKKLAPAAPSSIPAVQSVTEPRVWQNIATPPIVAAARSQVGKTVSYDSAYVGLAYPGGDLPIEKGVCTDVVVRALRDAFNMDLQRLVQHDMKTAFSAYPNIWGLKKPDRIKKGS